MVIAAATATPSINLTRSRMSLPPFCKLHMRRFTPESGQIADVSGCVDGSELARLFFTSAGWSVQPCVRPICAVDVTAGHNALRGSGPGQKPAFDDAPAQ